MAKPKDCVTAAASKQLGSILTPAVLGVALSLIDICCKCALGSRTLCDCAKRSTDHVERCGQLVAKIHVDFFCVVASRIGITAFVDLAGICGVVCANWSRGVAICKLAVVAFRTSAFLLGECSVDVQGNNAVPMGPCL